MYQVTEKQNITLNGKKATRAKIYELINESWVFVGFCNAKGWNASNPALLRAFAA